MKSIKSGLLIFPHQLFENHELLESDYPIFLWEAPRYFTDFSFHKQKLIFHHASMNYYHDFLKSQKKTVHYCTFDESIWKLLRQHKISHISYIDPVDTPFESSLKKMLQKENISFESHQTPAFLTPMDIIKKTFDKKDKTFRMQPFYIAQRKRLNILIKNGEPLGGAWNLDTENRKKIPVSVSIPAIWQPKINAYVSRAKKYVEKKFANNPGDTDSFCYPITHDDAKKWLDDFLKKRFKHFGDYQDAINYETPFLFHSILSPLLNAGLLIPEYVIKKATAYGEKHNLEFNNIEGFIRQIIGWREYVRGIYTIHGNTQRKSNFFKNKKKLGKDWWSATTGIAPIDQTIEKVLAYSFAHHIERLMILGNYMLLSEIEPNEVYNWFMELFIDSYDWVMVPNVFGMSQFADGGLMMTKPYISSSNYIRSMSTNFKKAEWCQFWDAKYWYFLHKNRTFLSKNPRMALVYQQYYRLKPETLKEMVALATSEKKR
ncbi:cryptochrome/photolyase family protein [Candidatus Dependentiae bacterium]|nr:cryptochrome/photolyase family protein [Candidatus Dependentiae bacterium]